MVDDLTVLYDFYKEEGATEEEVQQQYDLALAQIEDLEFKNMLSAEEDALSAVLPNVHHVGRKKWLQNKNTRFSRW